MEIDLSESTLIFFLNGDIFLFISRLKLLDGEVLISPRGNSKRSRQQWGMSRTHCRK